MASAKHTGSLMSVVGTRGEARLGRETAEEEDAAEELSGGASPCCMVPVHVVIVGCGRVGSGLAVGLVDRGHSVSIVDKLAKAFRRLPGGWPGTTIVGSGFDRDDLERAGAQRAGALAAVTSGDNTNILTARIARETYGIANVVARIYDPRRAEIYERLGIPTVATVRWTIDQVLQRVLPESAVEWTDDTGHLAMVDRLLPERWAGKRLRDVGLPGRATLVAVTRAGTPRLNVGDLVGQEGDVLHMAVLFDAIGELEEKVSGAASAPPRTGTDAQ